MPTGDPKNPEGGPDSVSIVGQDSLTQPAIPLMPMPFSTASFTMLTGSTSMASHSASPARDPSPLDPTDGTEKKIRSQQGLGPRATSRRNGGRHQLGIAGRLRRNE